MVRGDDQGLLQGCPKGSALRNPFGGLGHARTGKLTIPQSEDQRLSATKTDALTNSGIGDVISLGEDISGEYVVCEHRRWGHKDFMSDDEVLIHECSMDAVLIWVTKQSVIPESEECLYRIWVARLRLELLMGSP